MEIYRLSLLGYKLSHTVRHPENPSWRVIYYLAKMHVASKEKILGEVDGATLATLTDLKRKRIIVEETGVNV